MMAEPDGKRSSSNAAGKASGKASGKAGEAVPEAAASAAVASRVARQALRKKLAAVALVAGLCLGVVVTRAVWAGTRALAAGDAASKQGESQVAITEWRRAARWYVPGARHMGEAYDRLERLAHAAEEAGERDTALAAWRSIRGSILATRSFYTPFAERLDPANQHIADLMAALEDAAALPASGAAGNPVPGPAAADADADGAREQRAAWHYDLLIRDHAPSPFWSLLAILGFALWFGGGLLFALRGVTADDELVPRTAAHAGILVAAGLLIWMLGLHLA